jgi:secretion/DNA translocation related TadE-like protein
MKDDGSATVWAALIVTVAMVVTMLVFSVTGLVRLHHQTHNAADLAALAATSALMEGSDGCSVAKQVLLKNQAKLVKCDLFGVVATITAQTTVAEIFGTSLAFKAKSRAAPAGYL